MRIRRPQRNPWRHRRRADAPRPSTLPHTCHEPGVDRRHSIDQDRRWRMGIRVSPTRKVTVSLPTRPLGRSGLNITKVGFGSWAIGSGGWMFGWGSQDRAECRATMRHALNAGVNWIDTAAVYGFGQSEELVGQFLRELPVADRPFVFTKCGLVWNARDRMASPTDVLTPASVQRECEASL